MQLLPGCLVCFDTEYAYRCLLAQKITYTSVCKDEVFFVLRHDEATGTASFEKITTLSSDGVYTYYFYGLRRVMLLEGPLIQCKRTVLC